jgi:hypothetical protein
MQGNDLQIVCMMIDTQIRNDFKTIATEIGCQGFIANFISAMNDGGNQYPLFLLLPIATSEAFTDTHKEEVKILFYIFKLNQNVDGKTPNEAELWTLFGEVSELAKAFKRELLKTDYIKKYVITSKMNIERNAYQIGVDDTVFVKVNFTMMVFKDC